MAPTASNPDGEGPPLTELPMAAMFTSEVMTWSPAPKKMGPGPCTVPQWIPSDEYHKAADRRLPLTDEPAANTPSGVDRMSLMTAPGSPSMTLSAPGRASHCSPSVEYQTVAFPSRLPAANRPSAPAAKLSMAAPVSAPDVAEEGGSNAGLSAMATKGWPGARLIHTAARCAAPPPTEPTTTSRSPQSTTASASSEPIPPGEGNTVLDQVRASGELQTVASAGPPVLNWVPAINHCPRWPGCTTSDSVLVRPPPSWRLMLGSRCHV